MSAAQAIASKKFLEAMGPMVTNEKKMQRVLQFIYLLQDDAPCRFSEEEVIAMGHQAVERAKQGIGVPHDEAKKIAAQWLR